MAQICQEVNNLILFLKQGSDNGIFTYKLKSDFELILYELYSLAIKSNGFSLELDYLVIKDYCKSYNLNSLEVLAFKKSLFRF